MLVVRVVCNYLDCFVDSIIHFVYHHCVECWCTVRIRLWMLVNNFMVSINLRNSVESLRYEGSFFTCGCSHLSTNCDMGSVTLLQLDTIGLIPMGFL